VSSLEIRIDLQERSRGLTGEPHPSTKKNGRDMMDIGVNNAVAQIKKLMAERRGPSLQ
jgi:hypothetical protein